MSGAIDRGNCTCCRVLRTTHLACVSCWFRCGQPSVLLCFFGSHVCCCCFFLLLLCRGGAGAWWWLLCPAASVLWVLWVLSPLSSLPMLAGLKGLCEL